MSVNGIKKLTERGVLAHMLHSMATMGDSWFAPFTRFIESTDPTSEQHAWVTGVGAVREQTGKPEFGEVSTGGQIITHKDWVCGVRVPLKMWLANKAGFVMNLVEEAVQAALAHPGIRIQELVIAAESANCHDGEFFFDTDHSEASSGTQDNDITLAKAGTAPTVAEVKALVFKACAKVLQFKDAKGNYANMDARSFTVLTPPDIFQQVAEACLSPIVGGGDSNILARGSVFEVKPQIIPGWSGNKLAAVRNRAPGMGSAFLQQTFIAPQPVVLGPESEHAKLNDEVVIKVSGTYQLGYGSWRDACLGTFTGP